jgi:cob(I)alamin adenosyltransferase
MKIYTKTGDAGTTALVGGKRVSKASARLEAYGTIDELNSNIGLLAALQIDDEPTEALLRTIQNRLFNLGAYLATDNTDNPTLAPAGLGPDQVAQIEHEIDRLDQLLPPLQCFILPGGCLQAAQANVVRTICRRAERRIVALSETGAAIHPHASAYVNRLSDYFFTLARYLNLATSTPEHPWQPA